MKVTVSVFGRFHAFDMARELERHGVLYRLITSYPKYGAVRFGISRNRVVSLVRHEVANRAWFRYGPALLRDRIDLLPYFCDAFDAAAAKHHDDRADVFVGWASKCLHGLLKARSYGQLAVLDRGSSHCLYAKSMLAEESSRVGTTLYSPSDRITDKELEEYDAADCILIPSSFVRRSFLEHGVPDEKLIQIPYGVSLEQFSPRARCDKVFRVIFAGSMKLRKGVHYLLQAFSELNLPDAELWLVGGLTDEMRPYFRAYEGTFTHYGHVPQSQLPTFYSQCSLFAICSIEEGLALVQPQAMACGLPLLCTTNTGGDDLIEDGTSGFVVPIRSIEAIKEKILWCYENQEECSEMGRQARLRVQQGLTWRDYGNRLVESLQRRLGPAA